MGIEGGDEKAELYIKDKFLEKLGQHKSRSKWVPGVSP